MILMFFVFVFVLPIGILSQNSQQLIFLNKFFPSPPIPQPPFHGRISMVLCLQDLTATVKEGWRKSLIPRVGYVLGFKPVSSYDSNHQKIVVRTLTFHMWWKEIPLSPLCIVKVFVACKHSSYVYNSKSKMIYIYS